MEATKYVEINEMDSAVVVGTRIHVEAIAHAYIGGNTEEKILHWFKINRVQFHGALAYYYEHQEEIETRITERTKQAQADGHLRMDTLQKLQNRLDDSN